MTDICEYQTSYTPRDFWSKLTSFAKSAGKEVIEKALLLYYAGQSEEAPAWAKATIAASLGYFITPVDVIVDLAPVVGYSDDLAVLVLALAAVAAYVNDDVRTKAREKMVTWFK